MEVENGSSWKVSTIGATHFSLPWLWEEEGEKNAGTCVLRGDVHR